MFWENSIETSILSRVKQITSPGWMHETCAQGWYTGKTQRDGMGREVRGGIGMGNTCKSMADSCHVWQKPLQYCKVISLQLIKINEKIIIINPSFFTWLLWQKTDTDFAPFLLLHQLSLGPGGLQSSLLIDYAKSTRERSSRCQTSRWMGFWFDRWIRPTRYCSRQASVASKSLEHPELDQLSQQLYLTSKAKLNLPKQSKAFQIGWIYACQQEETQELIMT